MGNCTIAGPWHGVEIVELVPDGLRIVLTVGRLLVRPVCKNDGNSDTCWISGRIIVDKRLRGVSCGIKFGNDVPRNCEDVVE